MASKSPLRSKTILTGAAFVALGFFDWLLGEGLTCQIAGTGIPSSLLVTLSGVLTIILRMITKTEIKVRKDERR